MKRPAGPLPLLCIPFTVAGCLAPQSGLDAGSPDAGYDAGPACWGDAADDAWPTDDVLAVDDPAANLGNNHSGAVWDPQADALLVVINGPSLLRRLVPNASTGLYSDDPTFAARTLLYPSGAGAPDSEGVTLADVASPFVFVATERDNDVSATSRLSVLRFDTSAAGTALIATHEWDLTADLAGAGVVTAPNAGLEAITFIPDGALTAGAFEDDNGQPYTPSAFGDHAGGLFLVGLEGTGDVFAYALTLDGSFTRIAAIDVGLPIVVSLEYDRATGVLFAGCDDGCGNATKLLALTDGDFTVIKTLSPPPSLGQPGLANNEGLAIAPGDGVTRPFFWARDGAGNGAALFRGSFPVGAPCR